jgi:hypothetical protein
MSDVVGSNKPGQMSGSSKTSMHTRAFIFFFVWANGA